MALQARQLPTLTLNVYFQECSLGKLSEIQTVTDVPHKVVYNNKTWKVVALPTAEKELKYDFIDVLDNYVG